MKTRAMDKAKAAVNDGLYPFETLQVEQGYPSTAQFKVVRYPNGKRGGIKARIDFDSRLRIALVSGYAVSERRSHTLQLSSRIHLYDSWFCGLIRHSCKPNVLLDTTYMELWTLNTITAGSLLTLDYAITEDALYRQFACHCGELNCRGWITGSKEPLNAQGLAWWHENKRF